MVFELGRNGNGAWDKWYWSLGERVKQFGRNDIGVSETIEFALEMCRDKVTKRNVTWEMFRDKVTKRKPTSSITKGNTTFHITLGKVYKEYTTSSITCSCLFCCHMLAPPAKASHECELSCVFS